MVWRFNEAYVYFAIVMSVVKNVSSYSLSSFSGACLLSTKGNDLKSLTQRGMIASSFLGNNLYDEEQRGGLSSHWDRQEVIEKMGVIRMVIQKLEEMPENEIEQIDPSLLHANCDSLIESRLYEAVISRARENYLFPGKEAELNKLEQIEIFLNRYVVEQRQIRAKEDLRLIFNAMEKGPGSLDAALEALHSRRGLSEHLQLFIDNLIASCNEKFVPDVDDHGRLGEPVISRLLRALKKRISAHVRSDFKGNLEEVKILSFLFSTEDRANRLAYLKVAMNSFDMLERMSDFINNALDYQRPNRNETFTQGQIKILRETTQDLISLNPLLKPTSPSHSKGVQIVKETLLNEFDPNGRPVPQDEDFHQAALRSVPRVLMEKEKREEGVLKLFPGLGESDSALASLDESQFDLNQMRDRDLGSDGDGNVNASNEGDRDGGSNEMPLWIRRMSEKK
eukprot:GHVN01020079.1.p3 GENE.GHVN01020079.1~~GHVN01020079.1.p3  ORF type:complete len:452 (+),score=74.26 GHVN01020079.1:3356-4711(+)